MIHTAAAAEPEWWAFRVYGHPVGQGSMTTFAVRPRRLGGRRRVIVHDNRKLTAWREAVAACARAAGVRVNRIAPVTTGYVVSLAFFLLREGRGAGSGWPAPTYLRDLDKLTRAVLDALRGIAWADDGQVVRLSDVTKAWATADDSPGVRVRISRA
ncbi:MAG: RusA family crossover junction endodeoxyribonuclease [Gemmatimonadales bacterium]